MHIEHKEKSETLANGNVYEQGLSEIFVVLSAYFANEMYICGTKYHGKKISCKDRKESYELNKRNRI